jgi:hypothetical protein
MPRTVPSQVVELIGEKLPQPSNNVVVGHETVPFLMGVIRLTEEIPTELLTLSGEDYTDLVCGIEALRMGVDRWMRGNQALHSIPNLNGKNAVFLVAMHWRSARIKCPRRRQRSCFSSTMIRL